MNRRTRSRQVSSVRVESCRTLIPWRRLSTNLGSAEAREATGTVLTPDADIDDIRASAG
jgi:hypothetical protein